MIYRWRIRRSTSGSRLWRPISAFPSARSVAEAVEPERALEEERRLAYVAWTRARRSLTLVYDPGAPSQFLREAFTDVELGLARLG